MTFYLQDGVPDNTLGYPESRLFLDDHIHAACVPIRAIEAKDWKAARTQVSDIEVLAA